MAGHAAPSTLNYDDIYALEHFDVGDHRALSCNYPATLELYSSRTWPAFMLDILPVGAGRNALLVLLGVRDSVSGDWRLLLAGAGNPPGNMRVAQAANVDGPKIGFTRDAVVRRDEDFIEAMHQHGAVVGGTSGVQGEAPKFLLTEADDGLLYVDGLLDDRSARKHWLVKYPRARRDTDRLILRNEAAYHSVARQLGIHTFERIECVGDTLFIPRFDRRVTSAGVERYGQESLASLAGVAQFAAQLSHQVLIEGLARYATDTAAAIAEYVARDALSLALGNTDNHARNTAVTKTLDGQIAIAPLYDFAPMYLDEDGMPRVVRWGEAFERGHAVNWKAVIARLPLTSDGRDRVHQRLLRLRAEMRELPEIMHQAGVDHAITQRRRAAIAAVQDGLSAL